MHYSSDKVRDWSESIHSFNFACDNVNDDVHVCVRRCRTVVSVTMMTTSVRRRDYDQASVIW